MLSSQQDFPPFRGGTEYTAGNMDYAWRETRDDGRMSGSQIEPERCPVITPGGSAGDGAAELDVIHCPSPPCGHRYSDGRANL